MTIGQKIQFLREEQNMTQKELATVLGVTTGAIAEWEADEAAPNLSLLSKLSKALSVSIDTLLDTDTSPIEEKESYKSVPTDQISESYSVTPKKKRKKLPLIIGIVAALVLLVGVAALYRHPVYVPFSENPAAIEDADASVVTIFCYDFDGELAATGSGFVAFDGQTVITNYHVMTSAYTCKISTNQDISYDVSRIISYSKEQDIAILKLAKDTGLKPLMLGNSAEIKKGETVVAIGSPLGIKNTVSTGVLSGRVMEENMDVLQFTAPISSGSSGGALFDSNGKVIGITYASYINGQNLNLAIPIELATELFQTQKYSQKVSVIYAKEHPYVNLLEFYRYVPEITIDELLKNPWKYNDQTIKVTGYFSSYYSYYSEADNGIVIDCYIATAEGVTGSGEIDYNTRLASLFKIPSGSLHVSIEDLSDEINFLDPMIQPGDKVCLIVKPWYMAGERYQLLSIDYPKLIYSCD